MDPRDFPTTLPEFQQVFPNDEACAQYLEHVRWPKGFTCRTCGNVGEPWRFSTRPAVVLRCRECNTNNSLTAGTVMAKTRTPLSTWFWAAYLVTTQTPGQSALQFQRQLGISRYETAFQILHKLRAGMVRPERDRIGGEYAVEVDEAFVEGKHNKTIVIGAVEVRPRKDAEQRAARYGQNHEGGIPLKKLIYAGRLRLLAIPRRNAGNLVGFVNRNVQKGSRIRTDEAKGYHSLPGFEFAHEPLKVCGDPEKIEGHLPMIHLVFSNLKTWLLGTHHGRVESQHLQAYLNEYVYRFNRRFYPMTAFNSVLGIAAQSQAPTYKALYSGQWTHPG
jgi:hypothetical protein